ncbi:MMPL family transporter [Nocardia sp. NPDC055002]
MFQWGWASHLFGFHSIGFIQMYLPVIVIAVVFGLSMDYEVFLIGRMREEFRRTSNNGTAIVDGIEHTARPISAAAAIMIAVFASFITADVLELKQFGFALAVAVLRRDRGSDDAGAGHDEAVRGTQLVARHPLGQGSGAVNERAGAISVRQRTIVSAADGVTATGLDDTDESGSRRGLAGGQSASPESHLNPQSNCRRSLRRRRR